MDTLFIKDLFDWAAKSKTPDNYVTVKMNLVSNQQSGDCTYAVGTLNYHPGTTITITGAGGLKFPRYLPPAFATAQDQALRQYFNNPGYVGPEQIKGGDPGEPFDPTSTDKLGASISYSNGIVLITLHFISKGNAIIHFPANGISNVLYGNQNTHDFTLPAYLVSLTDRSVQEPIQ